MNTTKRLMLVVLIFSIVGIFTNKPAHAAGSEMYFAIDDVVKKHGPITTPLLIDGTYETSSGEMIKIDPNGGNAVIECNEASDWLSMHNAKISSSTAPIDNVKFSFWRTFDSLRVGTITYSVSGTGVFSRSISAADPNDWISLRGWVETTLLGSIPPASLSSPPPYPPNCALILTACATHQAASWTFNLNMPNTGFKFRHNFGSNGVPQLANGSDDLKAEFWIHLEKPADYLGIAGPHGIKVKYGAPAGDGGDEGGNGDGPLKPYNEKTLDAIPAAPKSKND